jgi:hypothetical protein
MKPPKPEQRDYEKIDTNDFVTATIEQVMLDENHEFKFEGKTTIKPAIRFKYTVDGYEYPHYSRWMTFSYGEKAELYKKYMTSLVQDAYPWMEVDIEILEGLKVKTLWKETEFGFQFVETIRPADGKKLVVPGLAEGKAEAEKAARHLSSPAKNGTATKKAAPAAVQKKAAPKAADDDMAEVAENDEQVPF